MRTHLNTLYVTTQGAFLLKDGETVLVRIEGKPKLRVPAHNLEGIVCFGNVSCTPFLMGHCANRGVRLSFLSRHGRFLARVQGPTTGNVLLRRAQYRRADDASASASLVRAIVLAKISNSRSVLMRSRRDHPSAPGAAELDQISGELVRLSRGIRADSTVDRLRGIEGAAARRYFGVFGLLIVQQREEFSFTGRSRRPPLDRVNALLSFLYTLLVHDVSGALEAVGLDPAVGYLHRDRPGRPSLALDLMEELRPYLADRLAVSLINLRSLRAKHFDTQESGAVLLSEEGRDILLAAYQKRKDEELVHPFLGEKTTVGMIPHLQALLFARCLRGDIDAYPPFLTR